MLKPAALTVFSIAMDTVRVLYRMLFLKSSQEELKAVTPLTFQQYLQQHLFWVEKQQKVMPM